MNFENAEKLVADLTAGNEEYRSRCEFLETQNSDFRKDNAEKDSTIRELQKSIAELTAAMTTLTERVAVVENINTQISMLFAVFEDSANSGLARKLGSIIKGR